MTMTMMIRSSRCRRSPDPVENHLNPPFSDQPITTSTCPTWKLYENPFYNNPHHQLHSHHHRHLQEQEPKQFHRLHLPVSARKIAASFWDLTFIRPIMDSELDMAKAQVMELKAELEYERKARKKMESTNKRLARELSEERKGREALERVCEELAREVSADKAEIGRIKKEMEEERKMLRMAEVFREERVQMKLHEAKLLLEEKMLELNKISRSNSKPVIENFQEENAQPSGCVNAHNNGNGGVRISMSIQRRVSPEPENPHIKRGIKGFVEFPRVVRAIGSRNRHLGSKLECQKAQLKLLLKQKSPTRSSNPIIS